MYTGLHVYYLLFLSDFNETWVFSTHFWKLLKYQFSWKSAHGSWVVPCGRTDRNDEVNNRLSHICERARNCVAKQHPTIMYLYLCVCIPSLQIKPCFTSHEQDHADVLRWDTVKLLRHICSSVSEQPGSHTHSSARKLRHKPPFPRPETLISIYQNYTTPLAT
jgi:hypothetical protein